MHKTALKKVFSILKACLWGKKTEVIEYKAAGMKIFGFYLLVNCKATKNYEQNMLCYLIDEDVDDQGFSRWRL